MRATAPAAVAMIDLLARHGCSLSCALTDAAPAVSEAERDEDNAARLRERESQLCALIGRWANMEPAGAHPEHAPAPARATLPVSRPPARENDG